MDAHEALLEEGLFEAYQESMASCIQRCIRLRAWRRRAAARKGGEGKHENKAVSLRESIQSGIILCVGLSTQNMDQLLACVGSHRGKGATSAPFQLTGSSSSVTVSSVNLETKYYSAHAWVCDTSSQGYRCDGTGTGWEDKEELGAGGEGCCALIIMVDSSDSEAMAAAQGRAIKFVESAHPDVLVCIDKAVTTILSPSSTGGQDCDKGTASCVEWCLDSGFEFMSLADLEPPAAGHYGSVSVDGLSTTTSYSGALNPIREGDRSREGDSSEAYRDPTGWSRVTEAILCTHWPGAVNKKADSSGNKAKEGEVSERERHGVNASPSRTGGGGLGVQEGVAIGQGSSPSLPVLSDPATPRVVLYSSSIQQSQDCASGLLKEDKGQALAGEPPLPLPWIKYGAEGQGEAVDPLQISSSSQVSSSSSDVDARRGPQMFTSCPALLSHPWRLDTKYYTAAVNLCRVGSVAPAREQPTLAAAGALANLGCDGLVVIVPLASSGSAAESVLLSSSALLSSMDVKPGVVILIGYGTGTDKKVGDACRDWAAENFAEFITVPSLTEPAPALDPALERELGKQGMARAVEVLHCHMWSNMVMKAKGPGGGAGGGGRNAGEGGSSLLSEGSSSSSSALSPVSRPPSTVQSSPDYLGLGVNAAKKRAQQQQKKKKKEKEVNEVKQGSGNASTATGLNVLAAAAAAAPLSHTLGSVSFPITLEVTVPESKVRGGVEISSPVVTTYRRGDKITAVGEAIDAKGNHRLEVLEQARTNKRDGTNKQGGWVTWVGHNGKRVMKVVQGKGEEEPVEDARAGYVTLPDDVGEDVSGLPANKDDSESAELEMNKFEEMIDEVRSVRDQTVHMSDTQRRETASRTAMKMLSMLGEDGPSDDDSE